MPNRRVGIRQTKTCFPETLFRESSFRKRRKIEALISSISQGLALDYDPKRRVRFPLFGTPP